MRVATFNLLHGHSLHSGRVDRDDLAAAAAELDCDVLGLQEVDRFQDRSGGIDQTSVVAGALGAEHWRFVAAIDGTPGLEWAQAQGDGSTAADPIGESGPAYGVGLVSRFPVTSWHVRRFPSAPVGMPLMVPGKRGLTHVLDEPRVAVAGVLDGPAGPLTVVTAHLSFVPGWNVAQLRTLVAWARQLPGPRLLLGDLNLPGSLPRVTSRWTQLARAATYPSYQPRVQFDHVLADGIPESAVYDVRSVRLPVSDHRALVVDLRLG